jgi:hypothetical protein
VRSLEEARKALRIPKSADADVMALWGKPRDVQLVVYPTPDEPDRVAEFALLRVVKRNRRELVAGGRHSKLRLAERSNALWVVYGSIAVAAGGYLVIDALTIAPAFDGQASRQGDDPALGVTSQLLRLLSPPRILAMCVERLIANGKWLDATAQQRGKPLPDKHRELLSRIEQARPRRSRLSEEHLAELAGRYLTLYHAGNQQPRAQLAREFGITLTQVRDRIHQARQRGYLTPGARGRTGANPGPRLIERGWRPASNGDAAN